MALLNAGVPLLVSGKLILTPEIHFGLGLRILNRHVPHPGRLWYSLAHRRSSERAAATLS